jgi:amidase
LSTKFPFTLFPARLHPEIRAALNTVAGQLEELGHTVRPDDPEYGLQLSVDFLARSTSGLAEWRDRVGPEVTLDRRTRSNIRTGWLLSEYALRQARQREKTLARRLGSTATDRAIIAACPVCWPWNALGWPSINIPAGFTSDGLPIGLQLMGPEGSEPLLISLAASLEAISGWATKQPDNWWAG